MEKIILTGDRPTGRLHLGHYVGSLKRRVELQNSGVYDKIFIMIADAQALTDNADNPEKIPAARRYIDYYQETAANVLEHYAELKSTGLSTVETEKVLKSTRESISTLKAAFDLQFEKLMQNELMDMEADLNLLKQTLRSEGYKEPEKKGHETSK